MSRHRRDVDRCVSLTIAEHSLDGETSLGSSWRVRTHRAIHAPALGRSTLAPTNTVATWGLNQVPVPIGPRIAELATSHEFRVARRPGTLLERRLRFLLAIESPGYPTRSAFQ